MKKIQSVLNLHDQVLWAEQQRSIDMLNNIRRWKRANTPLQNNNQKTTVGELNPSASKGKKS